ncbi:MAG: sugar transferase, partial [Methanothrix sp.]
NGRDDISIEKKVELDTWYLHNRSFLLDIKIMLLTVLSVLRRKDVSH